MTWLLMLALSPMGFSLSLSCSLSPLYLSRHPSLPTAPTHPPPQCQELSDKRVCVASLQGVKELGDNNRAIRRSAANADASIRPTVVVCSPGRRQRKGEEEEEEVKMFHSEGDLSSSPPPRHRLHCVVAS